MYKADFKSRYFLRDENTVKEHIDWAEYDDPDALEQYLDQICRYSIVELLHEIDNLDPHIKLEKHKREIAKELLSVRIGQGFEIHYMMDRLQEQFQLIEQSLDELAKYKDHRHKLGEGHYSEKPVY